MRKIALLTYHSAYNYGSVLQAFALQQSLRTLGHPTDIINYRMEEQKRYYEPLYRTSYGVKTWVKDILQFPYYKERIQRATRFETFFKENFCMTKEVNSPEGVNAILQEYDIAISGSDQILNKHSCELEHNEWKYMDPYLLKGFQGRKISYASSIGNMTDEELHYILPELQTFDALSFRESKSAERVSSILEKKVETVLDPTFLLTEEEWVDRLNLQKSPQEKYILVYVLCGPKTLAEHLPHLRKIAQEEMCKVKIVAPFASLPALDKKIEYCPGLGPREFLNELYNAETIITDSYHGTILSVNFGKEFYSICKTTGTEFRKTDILRRLELKERIINEITNIEERKHNAKTFNAVNDRLEFLRRESFNYLQKAFTND